MKILILLCFLSFVAFSQQKTIQLAALPDLSPDGKELCFAWNGDLWLVSSDGGEAERITNHPGDDTSPSFSPDGKTIAFVSSREGVRQAYIMPKQGGVPKRVGFMSEGYTVEGWYPDGKHLFVTSTRDNYGRYGRRAYKLPIERKAEKEVFSAGVSLAVLNNSGDKVLFTREGEGLYRKGYEGSRTSQIWLYEEKTKDYTELLKGKFAYRSPMWSENGESFYFVSDEDGTFNIWKMDLATKKKVQLTHFKDDGVILPSISRNGERIVFRQQFDFYMFETSSGNLKKLKIWFNEDLNLSADQIVKANNTSDLDVSSDGLEFVFASGFDIWVMDKILKEPIRVTDTSEVERDVYFSNKNQEILCVRDDGVNCSIVKIERQGNKHWWQSTEFKETVILKSNEKIQALKISPKGKFLSYIKGIGDLYIFDLDSKKETLFLKSWDMPSYSWSPDDEWISYAVEDDNFNNDVWLKKVNGNEPAYNVSMHPEYDGYPSFSPDGKYLAFSSNRNDEGYQIAYVSLSKEVFDESSRDRILKKALAEMKKRKPVPAKKEPEVKKPAAAKDDSKKSNQSSVPKETKKVVKKEPAKAKGIEVDLDGLSDRVKIVKISGDDYNPFWSPDSKKLAFINKSNNKLTVQYISLPDGSKPTLLFKEALRPIKWLAAGQQLYCSVKNVPSLLSGGRLVQYPFSISYKDSRKKTNLNIFRNVWREMRDRFYDEKLNNKDWDKVREKYEKQAENAPDQVVFDRVVAMMLGELNASHLGYRSIFKTFRADNSYEITAHLGVKFDESFTGPGLKIMSVVDGSDASKNGSELKVGEVILSIDGEKCDITQDLTLFLNGSLKRDISLQVKSEKGEERLVKLRPHSYAQIRSLLYEQEIDRTRKAVYEKSKNKMGYLHVSRMMWPEFNKFKEEVFKEGNGRDGLVIDVRNNGGGFTADHLISVLTQPRHAITVPRNGRPGYPYSRQVYLHWSKPVVVLCNQNSYSNAEIFSHAIKSLGRGKLIGVPTAGGVISTGSANILGKGSLRIPFRGWYVAETGEDMEMNGAVPDIVIWPVPGELEKGKDVQLEKAIEVLQEEIKNFKDFKSIKLKNASGR